MEGCAIGYMQFLAILHRDLSIFGFWYPWGSLNQSSCAFAEETKGGSRECLDEKKKNLFQSCWKQQNSNNHKCGECYKTEAVIDSCHTHTCIYIQINHTNSDSNFIC